MNISSQVLWIHHVPGVMCKLWSCNVIQGESLNPLMTGRVRFKITNMLWHTCGWLVRWYICQLRYALEWDLAMFLRLHLCVRLLKMVLIEKVNHVVWLRISRPQECTRGARFNGGSGRPPHTGFYLVVVGTGHMLTPTIGKSVAFLPLDKHILPVLLSKKSANLFIADTPK